MTDLKELFNCINPTPSDIFPEDTRCYTCNNFITDLDREIANGDTDQCTECFIKMRVETCNGMEDYINERYGK